MQTKCRENTERHLRSACLVKVYIENLFLSCRLVLVVKKEFTSKIYIRETIYTARAGLPGQGGKWGEGRGGMRRDYRVKPLEMRHFTRDVTFSPRTLNETIANFVETNIGAKLFLSRSKKSTSWPSTSPPRSSSRKVAPRAQVSTPGRHYI